MDITGSLPSEKCKEVSVVIPAYNSDGILAQLCQDILRVLAEQSYDHEIIVVDDHGKADLRNALRKLIEENPEKLRVLRNWKNQGQAFSTWRGIKEARKRWVVTIDDDYQHPPNEIPRLIGVLEELPHALVLIGKPRVKKHAFLRNLASDLTNRWTSLILNKPRKLYFSAFRVLKPEVVHALKGAPWLEMPINHILWSLTSDVLNEDFDHKARLDGTSSYSLLALMRYGILTVTSDIRLLCVILMGLGLGGFFLTSLAALFFLLRYLYQGSSVAGWTALFVAMMVTSSLILLSLGILGQQIGRIKSILAGAWQGNPLDERGPR